MVDVEHLREVACQYFTGSDAYRQLNAAADEILLLRSVIDGALNELGVPNEDYPAPVSNAVSILRLESLPQRNPDA